MASLLNHVPAMKIRFWGVRGSIASPGHDTAAVGGNTSCVELACGDTRIVLDAGTGLRALGNHLVASGATREPLALTLLLSHYHWDHIQGLPFFVPVYMKDTSLTIVGGQNGVGSVRETLEQQMCAPVFPVRLDEVGARITTREVRLGEVFDVGAATVRVARGNHPGGVVAYRVEHEGKSVVYATDTEHYAVVDPRLVELAAGVDLLVYDAQYTPEEYAGTAGSGGPKLGWGHSTFEAATTLAKAAGAKKLVLFHHDPTQDDAAVAEKERRARALFADCEAAREGVVIDI